MTTLPQDLFNSILKLAVETNNMNLASIAFSHGLPNNINDCISLALEKKQSDMVAFLIQKNPPAQAVMPPPPKKTYRPWTIMPKTLPMSDTRPHNNSPLMLQFETHSRNVLNALESGMISPEELNHQNSEGWTIFHYVTFYNAGLDMGLKIFEKFITLDGNINLKTEKGESALMIMSRCSASNNYLDMLLKCPSLDLNICNASGETALTIAIKKDKLFMVEKLLKDPRIIYNINTILEIIIKYGSQPMFEMYCAHSDIKHIRLNSSNLLNFFDILQAGSKSSAYKITNTEFDTYVMQI